MHLQASLYDLVNSIVSETRQNGPKPKTITAYISHAQLEYLFKSDHFCYVVAISVFVSLFCWVLTIATGNYSHMDRLWPILPIVYAWTITYPYISTNYRLVFMSILVTTWGVRLAFYFYIKGVYNVKKYDDYRWLSIKNSRGNVSFQFFNFYFIAFFQNILLVLLILPFYYVRLFRGDVKAITAVDLALAGLTMVAIVGEATADYQQLKFQRKKKKTGKGDFISYGLFRYSRHPNYFCEMLIFASLYLFTIEDWRTPINWSILGSLVYATIFQKSIILTESLSMRKYSRYAAYQRSTSKIIPNPFAKIHVD